MKINVRKEIACIPLTSRLREDLLAWLLSEVGDRAETYQCKDDVRTVVRDAATLNAKSLYSAPIDGEWDFTRVRHNSIRLWFRHEMDALKFKLAWL